MAFERAGYHISFVASHPSQKEDTDVSPMAAQYEKKLRAQLRSIATPATNSWFETYTKHRERYIGVKTPAVEKVVVALATTLTEATARQLSLSLLRRPYTEEKLAGMILYQKRLIKIPKGVTL